MKTFASFLAVLAVFTGSILHAEDDVPFPLGALGGKAFQTEGSSLLRVTEITAGGPAAVAGLVVGDHLFSVNGERLPVTGARYDDGWRGAVTELGYAIERAESSNGAVALGVLRPGAGFLTLNATLPLTTAWRPSYPVGDPRATAYFDKVCADLHTRIQASATGDFGANTGWHGIILLAHSQWSSTSGATPYRNSINKLRDRCVSYLAGRQLEPVESTQPGYVNAGLENWDVTASAMFLGEYRRKTGDATVDAAVQRAAEMLANRVQYYTQPDDNGVLRTKLGLMGHGGVSGDYAHIGLTGLNVINAHTMTAMAVLKGAGANFAAASGASGLTIEQKFQMNWSWLKSCTNTGGGNDDGNVGYAGVQGGYDSAARTPGSAAGYEIYLAAGGTAPTADDLDKLARMKSYTTRNWQRQQHAHAYTAGGVGFSQMLMPFLADRDQRYFMENSRFLFTLSRGHDGSVLYFPGRANSAGDSDAGYLGTTNVKYYLPGLAHAVTSGNLPSFPAPSTTRAFLRMNSPRNDWPALAARRAKVTGLVQALDLDVTDHLGTPLASGFTAAWSQISGATVAFSATNTPDTTVTFPAAGSYRLRLSATVGAYAVAEDYDFEVRTVAPPAGYIPGEVDYEIFTGITGTTIASLTSAPTFPNAPTVSGTLTSLTSSYAGDNYGQRIRGFLIPPTTGSYRLYIASDDTSQLRFNAAGTAEAGASLACSVNTFTSVGQWNKEANQQSALFSLTAGQAYFFEILHKEGTGSNHVAVGWTGPGIAAITVVPSSSIAHDGTAAIVKEPASRTGAPGGNAVFSVGVKGEGPFLHEWRLNGVAYWGTSADGDLALTNISAGMAGTFQCTIYHPGGTLVSAPAVLAVATTPTLTPGGLRREVWNAISGSSVSNLTAQLDYPLIPDITQTVTSAEGPSDADENYGQRLSGWLLPPTTGQYRFYIASDDNSELWLGTTASASSRVRIALKNGYTDPRQYSAGGQSALISLVAGQRYYIEILHKEGGGGDHVAVAWQTPGGGIPANGSAPIAGQYLESIVDVPDPNYAGLVAWWKMDEAAGSIAADAMAGGADGVLNAPVWTAGKRLGGLRFDGNDRIDANANSSLDGTTPFTVAAWIKVDAGANTEGVIVQQRAANGFNGQYQFKVRADGRLNFYVYGNSATQFDFAATTAINDGLWHHVAAGRDDAGNATIFLDGVVNGSITGTTVRSLDSGIGIGIGCDVRDSNKFFRGVLDDVRVYNVLLTGAQVGALIASPPAFAASPFAKPAAAAGSAYAGQTLAGSASDPNLGDVLTFTKTGGPAWLTVAADGTLGGTPAIADGGVNNFTVSVADQTGLNATATLQITVTLSPWQSWRQVKFGANADNASIAGDLADPDFDGRCNLLEYSLNTDPLAASATGIFYDRETIGASKYLRVTITKNPAATDVQFTVQVSGNLSDPGSWNVTETVIGQNTAASLIVRDSIATGPRHIRLRVTRTP